MKKYLIQYTVALALVSGIGCSKITDYNIDPNNPPVTAATPQLLLPSAVMSSAGQIGGEYAIIGGMWSQYYTQSAFASQYRNIDAYSMVSSDNNTAYQELYRSALSDYKKVQELSTEIQDWRFYFMATIMKAYTFQVLADFYDKIPYTEALGGSTNLQPKFDDGYTVYEGLLGEINDALSKDFKSVPLNSNDAKTDLIFGGDMDQWERFANTLKLKIYLRMVNAKASEAQQGIEALYAANAKFLETGAGITSFQDKPNYSNPFYEQNIRRLNTPDNLRASETFVSWLKLHNDPRIVNYFGSTNPSTINQGDYSNPDPALGAAAVFVQHATDPVWFISAAESYFMQAEARERYFGGAGAEELYNSGVKAAFAQFNLDPGTLLTGDYKYPSGTFDEKLEAIIVQKWASFPGTHDLEGFFEKNRTGYPKTSPVYSTAPTYIPGQIVYSNNGVTGGLFPERMLFPNIERSRNINTPAEVPVTTKVWWAQ
ncbi:MAG: SusD/RagB family nutrient-binding outer membrane lipoprotein [Bacteroidetes bacterium]|nr:MAG: SusD/RagB family nutrient-binding outer membrane lipoprotein [Bacteroidota bacterium]